MGYNAVIGPKWSLTVTSSNHSNRMGCYGRNLDSIRLLAMPEIMPVRLSIFGTA